MEIGGFMRIAICEDNKEHAEILRRMVERWAEQEKLKVDIGYYQSGEQFLFCMKEDARYDLAFLDIQLEKINGLQLARCIREDDPTILLVFTTGAKEYAVRGYEVSAFRYLLKPLKEKDVAMTLKKANHVIAENRRDAVIVCCNDESRRIYKNDICYIEVDDHHIVLHMKEETVRFRAKLKEFEQQFQEPQFCKCHRSYMVNLHYVQKISKQGLELENGKTLPISRIRWDALNRCYLVYHTARMG